MKSHLPLKHCVTCSKPFHAGKFVEQCIYCSEPDLEAAKAFLKLWPAFKEKFNE
jgi:hypothetical protein